MSRLFNIGDKVLSTKNFDKCPEGTVLTITDYGHSENIYWVEDENHKLSCVYYNEKSFTGGDNEIEPMAKPIVAPLELMTPHELVKHQQDVVVEALGLWCGTLLGGMKGKPTVVGGAPRDWDFMIPAQDIDIWVKNSQFGDEDLQNLKRIFEPLGGEVGQVTANTYARDGEYIHYIFNVMWQGVDLQFIFVEDPSVQAVVDHVCCNFSEIAWDWETRILQPTSVYKLGRTSRTLVFRDDKGRSPRECYIEKMSKRYPDHDVVRPGDDCPWESLEPKKQHVNFLEGEWKVEPFPEPKKLYVEALETNDDNHITRGRRYEVLKEGPKFYDIINDHGRSAGVYKTRFKVVDGKPEVVRRADQPRPDGYTKYIYRNRSGDYFLSAGNGISPKRKDAHVYTYPEETSSMNHHGTRIWIE